MCQEQGPSISEGAGRGLISPSVHAPTSTVYGPGWDTPAFASLFTSHLVALGCHLPTSGLFHVLSSRGPFLCHLGCVSCTCFLFGQFRLIPRSPLAAVLVGSSSARGCSARGPFLLEALVTGLDDGRGLWRKAPPLLPGLVLLGPLSQLSGFALACGVDMPRRDSGRQCPLSWRPACLWHPKPSACHPFSELLAEVVFGAIIQPSFSVFKAFKRSTFPKSKGTGRENYGICLKGSESFF